MNEIFPTYCVLVQIFMTVHLITVFKYRHYQLFKLSIQLDSCLSLYDLLNTYNACYYIPVNKILFK